jgi:hypothetical protein
MWVVVLNDGETYTAVNGSRVLWVPSSEQGDAMDRYVKDMVDSKGIDLSITETVSSPLSGDIYIRDLTKIEG